MRIFITGATGFIGRHLVRTLADRGDTVHALCRQSSAMAALSGADVQVFRGDILDHASIRRAMRGCDHVFHLAAYARNWAKDKRTFFTSNVDGTKKVLDAARELGARKVVYTSTELTFEPSNGVPTDETVQRSTPFFTAYEESKHAAEKLVRSYVEQGLDISIVHPTRVFGPGLLSEANSVTIMIQLYLEGKWRLVPGDGESVGNYAFVNDVAHGHVRALESGKAGESYILGGENISFNGFFDLLADISKRRYHMFHLSGALAMSFSRIEALRGRLFNRYPLITPEWTRLFLTDWACSPAKAQRELGYSVTPLRDALEKTVRWLQASR